MSKRRFYVHFKKTFHPSWDLVNVPNVPLFPILLPASTWLCSTVKDQFRSTECVSYFLYFYVYTTIRWIEKQRNNLLLEEEDDTCGGMGWCWCKDQCWYDKMMQLLEEGDCEQLDFWWFSKKASNEFRIILACHWYRLCIGIVCAWFSDRSNGNKMQAKRGINAFWLGCYVIVVLVSNRKLCHNRNRSYSCSEFISDAENCWKRLKWLPSPLKFSQQ